MVRCQYAPIVSRPYQEITYVAWLEGRTDCLVVDPGLEPDLILQFLDERQLTPAAISDHAWPLRPHRRKWRDESAAGRIARSSSASMKRRN